MDCQNILNNYHSQLFNVYLSYRYDPKRELWVNELRRGLEQHKFKVIQPMPFLSSEHTANSISKCKVIVCILDEAYSNYEDCLLELQSNKDSKFPRQVTPLFLKQRGQIFRSPKIDKLCNNDTADTDHDTKDSRKEFIFEDVSRNLTRSFSENSGKTPTSSQRDVPQVTVLDELIKYIVDI